MGAILDETEKIINVTLVFKATLFEIFKVIIVQRTFCSVEGGQANSATLNDD